MSRSSLVNVIQTFPWNISRNIYAAPSRVQSVRVSGVSFDWEYLLTSAFVDAKIIIKEWLLLRRMYPHKNDMDFSDLHLFPSTQDFRRKVLARACLFEEYEFYELISKAYLYMVALYEEEQDYLTVFTELQYAVDQDNKTSTHTLPCSIKAPSLLANSDWAILARWLKRAVVVDLQSLPALLAAAALSTAKDGASVFSLDVARRLLREHFLSNASSSSVLERQHQGRKSQQLDQVDAVQTTQTEGRSLLTPSDAVQRHTGASRNLQADSANMSGTKRVRVDTEECMSPAAAESIRQRQVQNAQASYQQQQLLNQQRQYASSALAAYRGNPYQPLSSTSHSDKEQTESPRVQHMGQHPSAASTHWAVGKLDVKADAPCTVPYPPQAVLGPSALAAYYAGSSSAFPSYGPSVFLPGSPFLQLGEVPGSSSSAVPYSLLSKSVESSWNWSSSPQHCSSQLKGNSDNTSVTGRTPSPLPLPLLLHQSSGYAAELWKQAESSGLNNAGSTSLQPSAGMGPPAFPRSQSGVMLSHGSSTASLQASLSPGSLGMGRSSQPYISSSNTECVRSISASPQPALSLSNPNSFAVNRRQKKNRDKFRVTFQFSMARASELQNKYGLSMDPPPLPVPESATADRDLLHSHTSKPSLAGDAQYSVLVALKGIDVLPNGRYRVQLNTFMNGRKKFSRNSADLYEALWIFEIALLISDSPSLLPELQRIGNYNCLATLGHLGLFATPREYYLELGRHILLFYDTVDFFNEDLITFAINNYDAIKPGVTPMLPSFLQPQPAEYSVSQTRRGAVGLSSTVSNDDSEDDSLQPNTDVSVPAVAGSAALYHGHSSPHISRTEAVTPLSWMAGFSAGLSLQEQHLSCLFCLRTLGPPAWLPHMSMIKEDKLLTTTADTTTTDTSTTTNTLPANTASSQP